MNLQKIALIMRGSISKTEGKWSPDTSTSDRINYEGAYNSILKHIINANPQYVFDIFMHSWDVDIAQDLVRLYRPTAHSFESNELYKSDISKRIELCGINLNDHLRATFFRVASQSLAIKKSIELVESHVLKTNTQYEHCIICRPDVMYLKKLDVSQYTDKDSVYVNGPNIKGDYHFVMSYENLLQFKGIYDSLSSNNLPMPQKCIAEFVRLNMSKPYIPDNLKAPEDLEVLRKISRKSLIYKLNIQELLDLGVTVEQLKSYTS